MTKKKSVAQQYITGANLKGSCHGKLIYHNSPSLLPNFVKQLL